MRKNASLTALGFLLLLASACGGGQASTVSEQIAAADGGTVSIGGNVVVRIPSDALSEDATVTITRASEQNAPPGELDLAQPVGVAFNIDIGRAKLSKPVTLEIAYDPTALPQAAPEDVLFLAFYDQAKEGWVPVGGVVDVAQHIITVETDHLSWWNPFSWNWPDLDEILASLLESKCTDVAQTAPSKLLVEGTNGYPLYLEVVRETVLGDNSISAPARVHQCSGIPYAVRATSSAVSGNWLEGFGFFPGLSSFETFGFMPMFPQVDLLEFTLGFSPGGEFQLEANKLGFSLGDSVLMVVADVAYLVSRLIGFDVPTDLTSLLQAFLDSAAVAVPHAGAVAYLVELMSADIEDLNLLLLIRGLAELAQESEDFMKAVSQFLRRVGIDLSVEKLGELLSLANLVANAPTVAWAFGELIGAPRSQTIKIRNPLPTPTPSPTPTPTPTPAPPPTPTLTPTPAPPPAAGRDRCDSQPPPGELATLYDWNFAIRPTDDFWREPSFVFYPGERVTIGFIRESGPAELWYEALIRVIDPNGLEGNASMFLSGIGPGTSRYVVYPVDFPAAVPIFPGVYTVVWEVSGQVIFCRGFSVVSG